MLERGLSMSEVKRREDASETEKPEWLSFQEWENIAKLSDDMKMRTLNYKASVYGEKPPFPHLLTPIKQKTKPTPEQLPLWPDPKRGSPNAFLRSALFPAIQGKNRTFLKKVLLPSQKGYVIKYTGEQLDQSDNDVWLQAVHLARCSPLGTICTFTGRGFLKAIGRHHGGHDHDWLKEVIVRLRGAILDVKKPDGKWDTYSLFSKASGVESKDYYKISFDKELLKLFAPKDWTALEWKERKQLKRKSLALWLHSYYSSHKEPFPVKTTTLCTWSGSAPRNFKTRLTAALDALCLVTGWVFFIDEEDTVFLLKHPAALAPPEG